MRPAPTPEFEQVKAYAQALFREARIERHPMLLGLAAGEYRREQKAWIALQIYHVARVFPRFISAMITNLESAEMRMPLVESLLEEHGQLDLAKTHVKSYRDFLVANGIPAAAIDASRPVASVVAYNRAIIDLCLHHEPLEGIAALGVIEEVVARVSPVINSIGELRMPDASGVQAKLPTFFEDHALLDVDHADDLYALASPGYADPKAREAIERGLELGLYYHARMYSDLHAQVSRT